MLLIDTSNNSDTDLFLVNVNDASYFYKNVTITNDESEIAEMPTVFCITAHPNQFNLNKIITANL
jgi:hypothetical protein